MAKDHLTQKSSIFEDHILMRLKDNLRDLIQSNGITVAHLSRATKTPLQTLHGWLSGVEPRSLKQVKVVAEYFELSIDDLCFDSPALKKKKDNRKNRIEEFQDEINAGTFEVVLRRVKK